MIEGCEIGPGTGNGDGFKRRAGVGANSGVWRLFTRGVRGGGAGGGPTGRSKRGEGGRTGPETGEQEWSGLGKGTWTKHS